MRDLIAEVESLRQSERMSQAEVAGQLGVSQGQYSKVVAKRVPLAPKMAAKLAAWLNQRDATTANLDREILDKCIELMHLLQERVNAADKPGEEHS